MKGFKFGAREIVAVGISLLLLGGLGLYLASQGDTDDNQPEIIDNYVIYEHVMEGASYDLIDEAGSKCQNAGPSCSHSVILQLSKSNPQDFEVVANKLIDEGWKTVDGEPFFVNIDSLSEVVGPPNKTFTFITLNLEGQSYLEKDGFRLSLFPFTDKEVQKKDDPYYILRPIVAKASSFDFDKIFEQHEEGKYFLNVSVEK